MFFLRLVAITALFSSSLVNASGYVDKDHYLYPIMIDIRYKKYDEAMAKLEPHAEQGDAQALFWYGYMKQQNFGRDRYGAYKWFEKAGEFGNPYALFKLSGIGSTSSVCEANGWKCSEKNLDKALEHWKELSNQGDAKAELWYRVYNRSFIEKLYDKLTGKNQEYILNAARKGYIRPLARSVKAPDDESYREYWGEEMYQALLDNINKDPQIAMHFVYEPYEGMTIKERRELLLDSLNKGYRVSFFDLFIDEGLISKDEAYIFRKADYLGSGQNFEHKYFVEKFEIEPSKVGELNEKSEDFFNSMEHVINFDEKEFMFMFDPDV